MQLQYLSSEVPPPIWENPPVSAPPPPPPLVIPSHRRCGVSSFPAHISLHRTLGISIFVGVLVSIILVATKTCDRAVIYEPEARQLIAAQSIGDHDTVNSYVRTYYFRLQALHVCILLGSIHIIVLGALDLVPKHDTDCRFAFHFVSVFIIFIVAGIAVYSTFVAFTRPCEALGGCCSVMSSPGLLARGDRRALTAFSIHDSQMILVMGLDLAAFAALVLLGIVYFRDVRQLAADCGYLHRVHNEGYIIRNF